MDVQALRTPCLICASVLVAALFLAHDAAAAAKAGRKGGERLVVVGPLSDQAADHLYDTKDKLGDEMERIDKAVEATPKQGACNGSFCPQASKAVSEAERGYSELAATAKSRLDDAIRLRERIVAQLNEGVRRGKYSSDDVSRLLGAFQKDQIPDRSVIESMKAPVHDAGHGLSTVALEIRELQSKSYDFSKAGTEAQGKRDQLSKISQNSSSISGGGPSSPASTPSAPPRNDATPSPEPAGRSKSAMSSPDTTAQGGGGVPSPDSTAQSGAAAPPPGSTARIPARSASPEIPSGTDSPLSVAKDDTTGNNADPATKSAATGAGAFKPAGEEKILPVTGRRLVASREAGMPSSGNRESGPVSPSKTAHSERVATADGAPAIDPLRTGTASSGDSGRDQPRENSYLGPQTSSGATAFAADPVLDKLPPSPERSVIETVPEGKGTLSADGTLLYAGVLKGLQAELTAGKSGSGFGGAVNELANEEVRKHSLLGEAILSLSKEAVAEDHDLFRRISGCLRRHSAGNGLQ